MSNTYHHFSSYKRSLDKIEKGELNNWYWKHYYRRDRSPKAFTKLYKIIPHRRKTKTCLIKQMKDLEKDVLFPLENKPHVYYT